MPQIDMSKKIKKSQDAILSIIEAEKAIESAKASDAEGDGSEVI
jgi:hypothetical protein